jgi:hypothetical protein
MTRITAFLLLLMLLAAGCLPQAKQQTCGSGSIFSSSSRECVPITSGGTTNGVSIANRSPALSNVSVLKTDTTGTLFTVTVQDSLNQGYTIRWVLYPPSGVSFTGNPLLINSASYILTPATAKAGGLDVGVWTLSAEVMNSTGTSLLTSAQWVINVSGAPTPTLTSLSGAPTSSRLTTSSATFTSSVSVTDSSAVGWRVKWFYDGQLMQQTAISSGSKTPTDIASLANTTFVNTNLTSADDLPQTAVGPHVIRAELTNTTGTIVYDAEEWTIYIYAPNMPQITSAFGPATTTVVTAIDNVTLASGGFRTGPTPASSIYNATAGLGGFCLTTNDFDGSGSGVLIEYYKDASVTPFASTSFPVSATVCLDDIAVSGTTYAIQLANSNVGEYHTLTAKIRDVATNTVSDSRTWGISVRPRNTAPVVQLISPASPNIQLQDSEDPGVTVTATYVLNATDDDTLSPDNMDINFYFDGVLMNGANTFPGTNVATPDCSYAAGAAPTGSARLQCVVALPAYDTTGRINPIASYAAFPLTTITAREYTISARASDTTTNGAAAQTSNTISWTVRPIDAAAPVLTNTLSSIVAQDLVTPDEATQSYIALAAAPATAITTANEGDDIQFSILVDDYERDDFRIQIERCTDASCTSFASAVASTLVTRTTDTLGHRVTFNYNIPENAITGAASGSVFWRITVNDSLPDLDTNTGTVNLAANSPQIFVELNVNNNNPAPVHVGPESPLFATAINVFTGMPFTFDPGSITDDSLLDGQNIQYQWQVSSDAGVSWSDITGSTTRVLRWTPPSDFPTAAAQVRLCLGDDGFGNSVAACTNVVGPWTSITPRTNTVAKNDAMTPDGEVATWFDSVERELYKVYTVNTSATVNHIVVEKYDVATTGAITFVDSLSFETESSGSDYTASSLSVVGQRTTIAGVDYRNLYISYVTLNSPSIAPRVRIRQIDLTNDEFQFSYTNFFESDSTTPNMTATRSSSPAGSVTLSVIDTAFDAGEYLLVNGMRLTPIFDPVAVPDVCEFQTMVAGPVPDTADNIVDNIVAAINLCAADDERSWNPTAAVAGVGSRLITDYPAGWIDVNYAINMNRVADMQLLSGVLIIPFLDNLNSNRLTITSVDTLATFASGSLGDNSTTASFEPTHTPLVTVAGTEIAASSFTAGNLDVAIVPASGGGLRSYRVSHTMPANTFALASTSPLLFSGEFVEKPRIATGPTATNNNVFILAQDSASLTGELLFARIDAAAYAGVPPAELNPFDATHEQASNLKDYRIRALTGNKRAAFAVLTNETATTGDVLVSLIKPVTTTSNVPMLRPIAASNYPKLAELVDTTDVSVINMSPAFSVAFGDAGAKTNENIRESVSVIHPSTGDLNSTIVNITEETAADGNVSATSIDTEFQPPYVK